MEEEEAITNGWRVGGPWGPQPEAGHPKACPATRSLHPRRATCNCFAFEKVSCLANSNGAQGACMPAAAASPAMTCHLLADPPSTHPPFPLQKEYLSAARRGNSCRCFSPPPSLPRGPAGVWEVALGGHPPWCGFTSALARGGESQTPARV